MSIKYTKKKGRPTNKKTGGTSIKTKRNNRKNRVTKKNNKKRLSRKKRGGEMDEPQTPEVPPPDYEPEVEAPEVPPPDFQPQAREQRQPRQEPDEPNENDLVQNIDDLVVGNTYQVTYLWEEFEKHRTYHYRDNDFAKLTRIEGNELYFDNIVPLDTFDDFYTWDNNQKLRIYDKDNFKYVLKGGKRKNKKYK